MARILWFGISPYRRTGYGVMCRLFAPLIRDLGHTVAVAQMGGPHPGDLPEFDGIPIIGPGPREYHLPRPMDIRRVLGGDPDLILVLKDAWVLPPEQFRPHNTAVWVNIDCHPMGAPDRRFFERSGATPVAVSKYGQAAIRDAGLPGRFYVPHGIDSSFWTPGDRQEARSRLGLPPGVFIAGLNAMNLGVVSRKAFFEQFRAFAQYRNRFAPGALLLAHTNPDAHKLPGDDKGIDLRRLAAVCGIDDAVKFASHLNMTEGQMRSWYRSLDVLLMATYGEGFGLPVLEAMGCGVPVIGTDTAALPEKIPTGAGWLVTGQEFWNDVHGGTWVVPSIGQITAKLAYAAAGKASPQVCRATATAYDAERITTEYWAPALKELLA
jgi:glycosyltransferase involved in cell wall biosynthesis